MSGWSLFRHRLWLTVRWPVWILSVVAVLVSWIWLAVLYGQWVVNVPLGTVMAIVLLLQFYRLVKRFVYWLFIEPWRTKEVE